MYTMLEAMCEGENERFLKHKVSLSINTSMNWPTFICETQFDPWILFQSLPDHNNKSVPVPKAGNMLTLQTMAFPK